MELIEFKACILWLIDGNSKYSPEAQLKICMNCHITLLPLEKECTDLSQKAFESNFRIIHAKKPDFIESY